LANNTQNKYKSNHQSGSNNKKNRQAGKNKKSYIRTNPKQQVADENRLKRVDEKDQQHPGKKDNERANSSNSAKKGNGNPPSKQKPDNKQSGGRKDSSAAEQSKTGNGNSSTNQTGKGRGNGINTSSKQAEKENGNGSSSSNQFKSKNGNGNPSSGQSYNGNGKKGTSEPETGANASEEHVVNHKEQSGKFETAFNRIHKALKEMVKGTDSDAFVELLYSGYKNHSLVRKYKNELHQFAKLRNAIVHERVNADYYIAEPHIEVVERIEEICREFEKPQTALSIATSPVFYYYEDAYLKDVLKVINKFDFTRFPVYDKDDKYVALLTSTEIIQWMAKHFSDSVVHFEDVRIKELLTKGKNYFVTFVDEDASLYHIEELFERYHTRGKKLQAVIITETGDRHGKPIGVITPWDLLDSDPED
jgi:CBS domain-containing protein